MSPRHVMILASAGSGKTYALTNRFVKLLAEGARPERIVALTFTRKAAGEFFDEILNKLARAAGDGEAAAQLARDIGARSLGPVDFGRMLRDVVEAMHRLRLGTLDGFFGRIARAFPFELGLTGEFEVLEEHAGRVERQRVLRTMFTRAPGGLDAAQREFIEAFKRATFGTEEKRLAARLDGFLDDHHETYLSAPSGALWGDPGRIWPEGSEWLSPAETPVADAVASLRASLQGRGLPDKQLARWDAFFAALPEWSAGAPLPGPVDYVVKNALAVWSEVKMGSAEMTVERKKLRLTPGECSDLAVIIRHVIGAEFARHLETTRGIHAVLRGYEEVYHDAVRRAGKLTFGDVQRLLLPEESGAMLSLAAEGGAGRLAIDYRLDGQFDHWLLDEFQDTSFGQWSVLRNLIDEAVQDVAGVRSFFCVGDVKQAIFTWRDGDPRLFREILEHYNAAAPGAVAEEHLVRSFRSGPAVIAMVNAVFGNATAIAGLFPGTASATWNSEWRDHESARPGLAGYATWLPAVEEEERFALTVRLLQEINPLERGLECAVLTQSNAQATALAEYLRHEGGIPALAESDLHVATDNPVGAALLALAQAAAHPGDTLAREHLAMTPVGRVLEAEGLTSPERVTMKVLAQIHADGFERTMEFWLRRLEARLLPDDVFSRERGRQFVAAAARFDATGSRDAAEFVAFMERHAVRGAEVSGVVRVMTIHKSKGLGFDVVILPDLEGQRLDQRREGLAVQRDPDRSVEWVYDLPSKLFYSQDEILSGHVRSAEAEGCYEALCLLYVAMTRAKRAMYVVAKPPGKSESRNYPRLLGSTLGETPWSSGDERWYEHVALTPEPGADATELATWEMKDVCRAPRRPARRPSAGKTGIMEVVPMFNLDNGGSDAAGFGSAVHALLAEVEWGNAGDFARLWTARGEPEEVMAEAVGCLEAKACAGIWLRRERAEVWRERAFEVVLDEAWVSGVFDRVIVERDGRGRVEKVTVFDFKTDRIESETGLLEGINRHAGQLNLYRRVAAAFTRVPVGDIACELVFTHLRRRISLPPA